MKPDTISVPVDLDLTGRALRIWAMEKIVQLHIGHGWEAENAAELTQWADTLVRYVERAGETA